MRSNGIDLDRPTPGDGPPHLLSLWTDDLAEAETSPGARRCRLRRRAVGRRAGASAVLNTGVFRLSYANCDPAGIVYYATYYPVFERVHTEWGWRSGIPSDELPALFGVSVVARASGCEYFNAGLLHDELRCDMRLGRVGSSSYTLSFDIVRIADELDDGPRDVHPGVRGIRRPARAGTAVAGRGPQLAADVSTEQGDPRHARATPRPTGTAGSAAHARAPISS